MIRASIALALLFSVLHADDPEYAEGRVMVTFRAGFNRAAAEHAVHSRSMRFSRRFDHLARARGRVCGLVHGDGESTARMMERLRRDPRIESVEPDYVRHVCSVGGDDPMFAQLWGLSNTGQTVGGSAGTPGVDIGFLAAWALADPEATQEVVVAVMDTGFDVRHPELAPQLWTNPNEIPGNGIDDDGNGYIDDVTGYDFTGDLPSVDDSGDHGTHVAGTLAAAGSNQTGITGVEPLARILPLKVSDNGDTIYISDTVAAMDYVVGLKQAGANIVAVNASYTASGFSNSERLAVEGLRDAGIVLCAVAGNDDGVDLDTTPRYPIGYSTENIIGVAAITPTGALASYSNLGDETVDLAAPGSGIVSLRPTEEIATSRSLDVGGASYPTAHITYSGLTAGFTEEVIPCGIGQPAEFPPSVAGRIALIERGTLFFYEKVTNAMAAGAAAAIIYDHTDGQLPPATIDWTLVTSGDWIPVLRVTRVDGQGILASLPATGTLSIQRDESLAYAFKNGTSMAGPHVTGAVAFAARHFPGDGLNERIARVLEQVVPMPSLAGKTTTGGRLDLVGIIDTDRDGLPDWWEERHFPSLSPAPGDDPDGDGSDNLTEFAAGSDPNDPDSPTPFVITSVTTIGNGGLRHAVITFPTLAGHDYRVEWSATLAEDAWQPLGSLVPGDGTPAEVTDPADLDLVPRRFYRVVRLTP